MEVFVAVVRFRPADDGFRPPQEFELLVGAERGRRGLLRTRVRLGETPVDAALRCVRRLSRALCRRAVPIPLGEHPSASNSPLVCVPVLFGDKIADVSDHRFCHLAYLLNLAIKADEWLEPESHYLITSLDEWLTKRQQNDVHFLRSLFRNRAAVQRVRACAHNPAHGPQLSSLCFSVSMKERGSKRKSSELETAVEESNTARAFMIGKEKYEKFLINPIFGGVLTSEMKNAAPDYFVKGRERIQPKIRIPDQWENSFPLHLAAYEGDRQRMSELIARGFDPNQMDSDSWTPLHYCAFYNRFDGCELLMLNPRTDVNATNRTGATALHFACLNGHDMLVELMLSHSALDPSIRDTNNRTALDFCDRVPKKEWQNAARLLRELRLRPEKVEVQLLGAPSLQLKCNIDRVTAGELRESALRVEGLNSPNAIRVFALWIISERLSLQLKAEKCVNIHLEKWEEHLEKWGDPPTPNQSPDADIPHIVLRRDARTLLGDERDLARNSTVAVRLLFGEAETNFLRGLIPCKEKEAIRMGAIIMRLAFGPKQSVVDAAVLSTVFPRHLIPSATTDRRYQRLIQRLLEAHNSLPDTNVSQLQFDFLQIAYRSPAYGCCFFKALFHRSRPPHDTAPVYVGLNDWGLSVIHRQTMKQIEAMELNSIELRFQPGRNYVEVHKKKHDPLVFNTPQAMLINNLFGQLKQKVAAADVRK